jgi:hypothetical protein
MECSRSQPCGAPKSAATEAEPSGAWDREAMQRAVNAFAEVIDTLALTPRQAEIGKAIIRAGIRKLNAEGNL